MSVLGSNATRCPRDFRLAPHCSILLRRTNRRGVPGAVIPVAWIRFRRSPDGLPQLHGFKRLGRPGPETIERKLGLPAGCDIHKDVVVLLLGRLALPIEVRRIVGRHFGARPIWKNWILFCAAAAQQQIFHAIHLVKLGRVHVPVEDDNFQVLRLRRNNLVGVLWLGDGTHAGAGEGRGTVARSLHIKALRHSVVRSPRAGL